jgi:hypothetical protein
LLELADDELLDDELAAELLDCVACELDEDDELTESAAEELLTAELEDFAVLELDDFDVLDDFTLLD